MECDDLGAGGLMMTQLGRISAAIEELEKLRVSTTPGPWVAYVPDGIVIRGQRDKTNRTGHVATMDIGPVFSNSGLIVAMHRTLDAQLALLRDARDQGADATVDLWHHASEIANAILGLQVFDPEGESCG